MFKLFEKINNNDVYIIAEMSANHGGSLEHALEIVRQTAKIGADCLKIQTYTADSLPEYRKDIVSAVKDMLNDNPELKQQLSDVICCTIDDNRYADYEPTESDKPFGGKLRLNSEFFTSNTLRADLAEESKVGWSVPNDSPQSIVSHELGHGIHLGLCALTPSC